MSVDTLGAQVHVGGAREVECVCASCCPVRSPPLLACEEPSREGRSGAVVMPTTLNLWPLPLLLPAST